MRAVVQRVSSASVKVDGETVSQISRGLMVLVGIGTDDTESDLLTITKKILSLRVFSDPVDEEKMWKSSVQDIEGDILCVSQFTLMANTRKGNKPDFHGAMPPTQANEMYTKFLQKLGQSYKADRIKDGKFGAMMSVSLCNEGPVTFTLDSRKFEYVDSAPASSKGTPKARTPTRKPSPLKDMNPQETTKDT
ncbi:D-tyrosyl-tRNA deacylase [Coprinellus micaceus]|uniref:D-aminoacyl-tRNA deacylase n=1 Tax=Coprinellus micaceus TaxID=71717 RepID=A0A4Y7SWJ6_COPMI|nr:D-tyrosyl-tRNA deacylase [Coprinellus micaceus]